MAFVPETSRASYADRRSQQSRESYSPRFLSELLNIYTPPQQDMPQPQYRENYFNSEKTEATYTPHLKMNYPEASYLSIHDGRVEHHQFDTAGREESSSLRHVDVSRFSEIEARKDYVDSAHQQTDAKSVESESGDSGVSKDDPISNGSPQKSGLLPKTTRGSNLQASSQSGEKSTVEGTFENSENIDPVAPKQVSGSDALLLKFNSLLKLGKEANLQADLPLSEKSVNDEMELKKWRVEPLRQNYAYAFRDSVGKGALRLISLALVNLENPEALSTAGALERQEIVHSVDDAEDSGQSMPTKALAENMERSESLGKRGFYLNAKDVHSSESFESKGAPRFISATLLNLESPELFSTEGTFKNQKGSDSQILRFDKALDMLTSGLLKSEKLVAQTNLAKGSQDILKAIEFIENIREKLIFMTHNSQQRAVLKLNPPELGRLEVRLELLDKACRAEIFVQNETAKLLIESQSSELAERLQDAGFELTDLFVSLGWDGDKRDFLRGDVQFSSEKSDEVCAVKKQSAPKQRINRLSEGVVDIIA